MYFLYFSASARKRRCFYILAAADARCFRRRAFHVIAQEPTACAAFRRLPRRDRRACRRDDSRLRAHRIILMMMPRPARAQRARRCAPAARRRRSADNSFYHAHATICNAERAARARSCRRAMTFRLTQPLLYNLMPQKYIVAFAYL